MFSSKMFAQRSHKYLIDAATIIAGLEGQEGSLECACLDILWTLLESNQIEVMIQSEEWNNLRSHIHKKIKEPECAEQLLNRIRKNIKPVQEGKDERVKLLYFTTLFQNAHQDIVSIEDIVSQHSPKASYNSANATIESLVFLFSVWLTKEIFGIEFSSIENLVDNVEDFLNPDDLRQAGFYRAGEGDIHQKSLLFSAGELSGQELSEKLEQYYLEGNLPTASVVESLADDSGQLLVTPGSTRGLVPSSQELAHLLLNSPEQTLSLIQIASGSHDMPINRASDGGSDGDALHASSSVFYQGDELSARSPSFDYRYLISKASSESDADGKTTADDQTTGEDDEQETEDTLDPSPPSGFTPFKDFDRNDHPLIDAPSTPDKPTQPSPILGQPDPATEPDATARAANASSFGFVRDVDSTDHSTDDSHGDWIHVRIYDAEGLSNWLSLDTNNDGNADWKAFYTKDEVGDFVKQSTNRLEDETASQIDLLEQELTTLLDDIDKDSVFDLSIPTVSFNEQLLEQVIDEIGTDFLEVLDHEVPVSSKGQKQPGRNALSQAAVDVDFSESTSGLLLMADDSLLQGGHEIVDNPERSLPSEKLEDPIGTQQFSMLFQHQSESFQFGTGLHSLLDIDSSHQPKESLISVPSLASSGGPTLSMM
ncbi:MAG: hypothetical protein ACFB12_10510 [Leptolyngbyaceae cyanobacterium]